MIKTICDVAVKPEEKAEIDIYLSALSDAVKVIATNKEVDVSLNSIHVTLGDIIATALAYDIGRDFDVLKQYTIVDADEREMTVYGYGITNMKEVQDDE